MTFYFSKCIYYTSYTPVPVQYMLKRNYAFTYIKKYNRQTLILILGALYTYLYKEIVFIVPNLKMLYPEQMVSVHISLYLQPSTHNTFIL